MKSQNIPENITKIEKLCLILASSNNFNNISNLLYVWIVLCSTPFLTYGREDWLFNQKIFIIDIWAWQKAVWRWDWVSRGFGSNGSRLFIFIFGFEFCLFFGFGVGNNGFGLGLLFILVFKKNLSSIKTLPSCSV